MSEFNRFKEQLVRTDGWEKPTDVEVWQAFQRAHNRTPYVRQPSGKTPEQIQEMKRKFKRKMAWRAFRERIARFIFRF